MAVPFPFLVVGLEMTRGRRARRLFIGQDGRSSQIFLKVKYNSKGREGVLQGDGHATIKAEDFFFYVKSVRSARILIYFSCFA